MTSLRLDPSCSWMFNNIMYNRKSHFTSNENSWTAPIYRGGKSTRNRWLFIHHSIWLSLAPWEKVIVYYGGKDTIKDTYLLDWPYGKGEDQYLMYNNEERSHLFHPLHMTLEFGRPKRQHNGIITHIVCLSLKHSSLYMFCECALRNGSCNIAEAMKRTCDERIPG